MHALLHLLLQTSTSTTKPKSSKSSGSSLYTVLFFVVVIGGVYLLFLRPRQQRMKQAQATRAELEIGGPVLTAGGIHGTLVALDDEVAEVEVAPGVVMTFLRRAVTGRAGAATTQASGPVDEEWEIPSRTGPDPDAEPSTSASPSNGSASDSAPADGADHTDGMVEGGESARTGESAGTGQSAETGESAAGETDSGDSPDRLT